MKKNDDFVINVTVTLGVVRSLSSKLTAGPSSDKNNKGTDQEQFA